MTQDTQGYAKTAWHRSDLTYCTNVHPSETLEQLLAVIDGPLSAVRQARRLPNMGSGLWLSRTAATKALASDKAYLAFSQTLDANGIDLFTLNGFPFGDFHSKRVKEQVYQPDWTEEARLLYTLDLAVILAGVMPPERQEGTISSVPLGFGPDWSEARQATALDTLCLCIGGLYEIHQETGCSIRLCLEMEPGCVLEETDRLIPFFTRELPRALEQLQMDPDLLFQHLGICFDVCHQAVMFEDAYESLSRIHQAGIPVGKIQISSALELSNPANQSARNELAEFIETRYLHQSCHLDENNQVQRVMDLDQAVETFPRTTPWRSHFHIPIQTRELASGSLGTTQDQILRTLDFLLDHPDFHPHLEVETYTWQVLPEAIRPKDEPALIEGLSAELEWLEQAMQSRGLLQETSQ
ncbi:MAG: AP endonuclease [endosymbiont of Escarpia spicata]|uniref:AP endonuclease n=1 Tax=endosymbiont of Escarpia spicata TaxID=2200908 RepID=A0A370DTE3_9GAMM|nr:MAG: AP endonuclease [endosymbiont of Escarpia spicata]